MLTKLCLRDIRTTIGKFAAIAAIIALGVGLFAGLRVSRTAMLATGQQYLEDLRFFDFRLMSTLGFTDDDVAAFAGLDGVAAAEGAVFQDALFTGEDGSDSVAVFHSLTSQVNLPDVVAGRMPEAPDECLVDADYFSADDLGGTLTLSADNDADTLDHFEADTFTIVGLANSPLYINYERGSTSLGNGTVSCFVYLPREAFTADYYTELYVTMAETADLYSDEYTALADALEPAVEALLEERADVRFDELYAEGRQELDDGWAELADARREYADGEAEAEQELADARQELEDARRELDDGWVELEDGWNTYYAEIADAQQELADAEQEIADGEQELADALQELQDGEADYLDGQQELEDGEADYQDGLQTYQDGLAEYEDGKVRYEQGVEQYEEGLAAYEEGLAEYEAGLAAYNSGRNQYSQGLAEFQAQKAQMDQLLDSLVTGLQHYGITTQDELLSALRSEAEPITAVTNEILSMLAGQIPGAPSDADALLAAVDALEAGSAQMDSASAQLSEARAELAAAREQLEEAKAELDDAKAQLLDSQTQLTDGWAELESGRVELEDARQQLDDGWAELADARQELDDGWTEYNDGLLDLEDARQQLADGRRELDEESASGRQELYDAEQELNDGEADYAEGLVEYADGEAEAEQELADAAREIADAEQELNDGEAELADLEPADTYVLGRDTNVGYVCFENDTNIVASVARVFPLFFFLVAALVCITTMTRMVEDDRTKLGVLKALGYSGGAIMGKYLLYAGSASLLGCVLGYLGGSWLFPKVFWVVYGIMYSFSYPIRFVLDWQLAAFSIGLYLLCALGSTWLVCRSSLREVAAELIRPKAPKVGKRILLERLTFLWKRLSFLHKVSARNIFRYKKRLFMMVLGIGGCTALLLTGFGIRDSISNIVDFQFDEIALYDSTVTFQDALDGQAQDAFRTDCAGTVADAVFYHGGTVDVSAGAVTKSVNLVAAESDVTAVWDFHLDGETIPYPGDGEALITNGLAEALGVSVGDTITVRDGDMNQMELTVSGIFENYIYYYLFVTPETYEARMGTAPEVKSAFIRDAEGLDPHAAAAELLRRSDVASVSVNADMRDRIGSMLGSLDYVVLLVILCAGSLAFIVLYNLTNINITERIREIATIKVLGFYPGETAAYVFRENVVLTGMGAAVGIVLGKLLHAYVMAQIRIDMMHFEVRVAPLSYGLAFALTFVFAAVVNLVMYRKLQRINMAESLKSIE